MTTAARRTPADILKEARVKDSRTKRARVVAVVDAMAAKDQPITFTGVAKAAGVSNWLVYAEGVREYIDAARKKQATAHNRGEKSGANASTASLATDLELARTEIRRLRKECDQLKGALRRKLGDQIDQMAAGDLAARVGELTHQNQKLTSQLEQAQKTIAGQAERVVELEDDLAASRTAHRNLMRAKNRGA